MSSDPAKAASIPISTRQPSKKGHACGPCRRLKRKCDLQIPCGSCKKGRNTKIDECKANPATPLSNIQAFTTPNITFGKVHKHHASPPHTSTSPASQNHISRGSVSMSSSSTSSLKRQRLSADSPSSRMSFSNVDREVAVQASPNYQPQRTSSEESTGTQVAASKPLAQQEQQQHPLLPVIKLDEPSSLGQSAAQLQFPQFSQPLLAPSPHQQGHHHQTYRNSFDSPSQVPPDLFNKRTNSASLPTPQSNVIYIEASEFMKMRKQLDDQFIRIQSLEHEKTQNLNKTKDLENQLKQHQLKVASDTEKNAYKQKYIKLLPSKIQTVLLVEFYLQNIDYIYHPLHHPSFRHDLQVFWKKPEDVDIGWLAVLFMVLSLAAIHLPKGLINIDSKEIEKSHKIWFSASRECVAISDSQRKSPSEFNLWSLQCFSLCQLYFYATKRAEQLNEILQKAVKDAYAMGLDKDDHENPNLLEVELKRRLWWDICGCDTFRALSLGVKPSIRSYHSTVPYPSNANDEDITCDFIKISSNSIPTDNSFNIYRAHMMKILNGIFETKHHKPKRNVRKLDDIENQVLKGLLEIDIELCETPKSWFFQLDKDGNLPYVSDVRTHFQHHMLHTCICIHRFRIYQNYLSDDVPIAWEVAISSARNLFHVYRKLRAIYDLRNPLFLSQIHQAFTGSIIQSMLLLLSHKTSLDDQTALYEDVELMLSDFKILGEEVFILKPEVLKESFKVLNDLKNILNKNLIELEKDQKDIVSNVFGGKDMTENYLKKCTVSFIIDSRTPGSQDGQEQERRQQAAYDYENQLGTLVTNELLEKSMGNIMDIHSAKHKNGNANNTLSGHNNVDTNDSFQNRFKAAILPTRAANPPTANDQFQPVNLPTVPVSDVHDESLKNGSRLNNGYLNNGSSTSSHYINGNSGNDSNDHNKANEAPHQPDHITLGTPFDLNFQDADAFWNDIGQQGIDELSNMYHSEFSGYKIF